MQPPFITHCCRTTALFFLQSREIWRDAARANTVRYERTSIASLAENIYTLDELSEIAVQIRMDDRITGSIRFQITFSDISLIIGTVHQYFVPWPILWWPTRCHFFIPLVTAPEDWIYINDDPPVVEQPVVNDLAHCELGSYGFHEFLATVPTQGY